MGDLRVPLIGGIMDTELAKRQIEMIIQGWIQRNPERWEDFIEQLEMERQTQDNQFASSKSKRLRKGLIIDPLLMDRIEKSFPEVFKDKEQFRWFMKEFKIFTVASKV